MSGAVVFIFAEMENTAEMEREDNLLVITRFCRVATSSQAEKDLHYECPFPRQREVQNGGPKGTRLHLDGPPDPCGLRASPKLDREGTTVSASQRYSAELESPDLPRLEPLRWKTQGPAGSVADIF